MKYYVLLIGFSLGFILSSCKKEEDSQPQPEPEIIIKIQVTDSIIFNKGGDFSFEIDASEVTATLTVIGAGGGGGGGVLRTGSGFTTGGGGGAGAGEVKLFKDVSLEQNAAYTIIVGSAGNGGIPGSAGGNGLNTKIKLGSDVLFLAIGGKAGLSNDVNSKVPGDGGIGFPDGNRGGFGKNKGTFDLSASAGSGGRGGVNQSGFGSGGDGGVGTAIELTAVVPPKSGETGQDGYIKIVWTGLIDK